MSIEKLSVPVMVESNRSGEMKAVPAVFRDRDSWQLYIENLGEKDLQELQWQIQTINSLTNNKITHGTTSVRVF